MPSRASLLAQPVFFSGRQRCGSIFFARMETGEGPAHCVAIDLERGKYHCSCPFFPKPCIHALALKTLLENRGDSIFELAETLPDQVQALLDGTPYVFTNPPDNAAQNAVNRQKTRFERLERAANGMDDLEAWLLDTARRGLATVVSEDPAWHENIASRMADASMTGISRSLRLLGSIPVAEADWAEQVASVLASCYLAARAFRKRDALPEDLLFDLQGFIGIPLKKETVLDSGERIDDAWAVLSQIEEPLEEKLAVRRTWLIGAQSKRYALLLDYAFGGEGFVPGLLPGSIGQGTLAFYPSAWPLRALLPDTLATIPKRVEKLPGYNAVQTFAQRYAQALAAQPWLQYFPAAFSAVTPVVQGNAFFVVDHAGHLLPLRLNEMTGWKLMALSGHQPLGVFGEWDGRALRPMSVAAEGRFVTL